MNQILDYGAENNDNNGGKSKKNKGYSGNNYGGNNYGKGKTPTSDKVVKVFAFLMIVLAIALIASGAMSILKNRKDEKESKSKSTVAPKVTAEILADLDQITGEVKITVNSPVVISKMIYSWDQDHDTVVSGNKQTSLEENVIAQQGEHVLHVKVIDEENNETVKEFPINSVTGMDTTKPDIVLTVTEDKKLLVTVTDDTSIDYVTYNWNDQEVVTMTPEEEGLKKYEFELDIPKGKNSIVIIAVDGSESANATTTSKVLEGVTKPDITMYLLNEDGNEVQVTCTHEVGIQKIYYTLNGEQFQWEAPEGQEAPKELTFLIKNEDPENEVIKVGNNEIKMVVTSADGVDAECNRNWIRQAPAETETSDETEGDDQTDIGADSETEETSTEETEEQTEDTENN